MAVAEHDPAPVSEERSDEAVLERFVEEKEGGGGGGPRRCSYRSSELEDLRFSDVEEQRRRWSAILRGLEQVVLQEYDQLSAWNQQKKPKRSDGRQQYLKQQLKKEEEVLIPAGDTLLDGAVNGLYLLDSYEDSCIDGFKDGEDPVIGEEPCEEDEDSDDEYCSIQRVAFCVEGEPDFESGPPQDGFEYLRRVRWEAAQIPNVKVVRLEKSNCSEQTPYMPDIPDIPKCPEKLMPLKHWEDSFVTDFSELRQTFSHLKSSNGELLSATINKASRNTKLDQLKDQLPTVSVILKMDPLSRAAMLKKLICEFENATTLSRDKCSWIFALCVAVDTPFDAGMSATMRCLLRKCSSLLAGKSKLDDEVVMLNVLVVISDFSSSLYLTSLPRFLLSLPPHLSPSTLHLTSLPRFYRRSTSLPCLTLPTQHLVPHPFLGSSGWQTGDKS